jgi:hypothetical protein
VLMFPTLAMKKMILLLALLAVIASRVLAHAGGAMRTSRFTVYGPFYWHPFFYPGPFSYGYPRGGLHLRLARPLLLRHTQSLSASMTCSDPVCRPG